MSMTTIIVIRSADGCGINVVPITRCSCSNCNCSIASSGIIVLSSWSCRTDVAKFYSKSRLTILYDNNPC